MLSDSSSEVDALLSIISSQILISWLYKYPKVSIGEGERLTQEVTFSSFNDFPKYKMKISNSVSKWFE